MENPTEIIYIRDKIKTINNATTNGVDDAFKPANYGQVGLNVYQIYPKTIVYPLNASVRYSGANQFMLAQDIGTTYNFQWNKNSTDSTTGPFNIGINFPRNFNIYSPSATVAKYVTIDYINSSGDLATLDTTINTSATEIKLQNAININSISFSDNAANVNLTRFFYVYAKDTTLQVVRTSRQGAAVITVPNSYIGVLSDIYINTEPTEDADIQLIVKDKWNNVKSIRYMPKAPYILGRACYLGAVNYPLDPGDSIFFGCVNASTAYKSVQAIVTLTAI